MTLTGIDISTYQYPTPTLTGLSFVFVRATYGATGTDSRWAYHSVNVRTASKTLGAYHFWYDGASGATQAAHFLAVSGSADLLALDFEGAAADVAGAKAFIAAVQAAGRKVGLYHSASGFPTTWGQDFNWVAQWSSTAPSIPWTFWQYADSYPYGGGDSDRFNGDAAALAALVGGSQGGIFQPGDDVDPTLDIPVATATIAPTKVYADRGGVATLIPAWAGAANVGVYSKAAAGTSNAAMPHGPTAIRIDYAGLKVGWVDAAAVTFPPDSATPYSQADVDAAKAAGETDGYAKAKTKAEAAVAAI